MNNTEPDNNTEKLILKIAKSKIPFFDSNLGDSSHILSVKDVTDSYNKQQIIERNRREIQRILDSSLDVICTIDADGVFDRVSNASVDVFGYPPDELSGRKFMELVYEDDREKTEGIAKLIREGLVVKNFENRYVHRKGHLVSVIWSAQWDNEEQRMYCVARDGKELKETQEKIRESEKRFKSMVQEGSDMIAILDLSGVYTYVSPNFKTFLGYREDELLGKKVKEFIHPRDQEVLSAEFAKLETSRRLNATPYRFRRKDGTWCWVQSVGTNLSEDNAIQGVVVNSVEITDLIETQRALNKSNERFSMLMRAGSESIWDYDLIKEELFLGDGFIRFFNIEPLDLRNNNDLINSKIHPEDLDEILDSFRSAIREEGKREWTAEYRIFNGQGYSYVKDKAIILRNEQDKAYRVIGAIKDVTSERLISEVEQLEKEVMELGMGMAGYVPLDQVLHYYMSGLERLFPGMKTSILRVESGHLYNLASPSLDKEYLEKIHGLKIGPNVGSCGSAAYTRKRVIVSDVLADERWANYLDLATQFSIGACWSQPVFDGESNVIATFANYYEEPKHPTDEETRIFERSSRFSALIITRFQHIDSIQRSNDLYQSVNMVTNDAIYEWDVERDVFYWGEGFYRIFGHESSDQEPDIRLWIENVHEDDRERVLNDRKRIIESADEKNAWSHEYRFKKADGTYVYVVDKGTVIRDEIGRPIRMIGAVSDISYRKATEIALRHLNEELGKKVRELASTNNELEQFAFIASHDLQEPLRMVTGFLQQIEKKYNDLLDDKGKMYIQYAVDGAERMKTIILDLLEFSRAGRIKKEDYELIDLNAVIEDVKILLKSSIEENKVKLKVGELPSLMGTSSAYRQVFQNIISNSIKYRKKDESPIINIYAKEEEEGWVLYFEDNGIGINPKYHDKIFEIFQRLHSRESYSGTGIGLAICKKIVENLDGFLEIDSEEERGSTFMMRLPKLKGQEVPVEN